MTLSVALIVIVNTVVKCQRLSVVTWFSGLGTALGQVYVCLDSNCWTKIPLYVYILLVDLDAV